MHMPAHARAHTHALAHIRAMCVSLRGCLRLQDVKITCIVLRNMELRCKRFVNNL